MKKLLPFLFFMPLFVIAGCGDVSNSAIQVPPTLTLIPAYISTAQLAEAAAQATQSAGRGQMAQMDVTATALSIEREVVSLQMTQAAATREHFQIETAAALAATQTAETVARQATQAAEAAIQSTQVSAGTATRQAHFDAATSTSEAIAQAHQATATEAALLVIRASAEAEAQRIRDEQATANLRTWLLRGFGAIVIVSVFAMLIVTLIKFGPAILSRLLVVRYNQKPYMQVLQRDGSVEIVDMGRSAGPAIHVPARGDTELRGTMDDPQMQTYVAVQAAIADIFLALNSHPDRHRWPWEKEQSVSPESRKARSAATAAMLRRVAQNQMPVLPASQAGTRYLPPEIVSTQFRELNDENSDPEVKRWLDDVEPRLLANE